MSAPSLAPSWSEAAIAHLRDATRCPVCGRSILVEARCRVCGADLATEDAAALWRASQAAATALEERERVRRRIPVIVAPAAVRTSTPPEGSPRPESDPATPRATTGGATTVQSVLAVAGAGLFAIAALIFSFFNPDLTDRGARSLVLLCVTALFLAGAALLHRRRLHSSAETVGALAVVFIALDVTAVAGLTSAALSGWVSAAVSTLVAGGALALVGARIGIRSWSAPGLVGLAFVPAMLGAADGTAGAAALGWLGTMAAAMSLIVVADRGAGISQGARRTEIATLTAAQLAAGLLALVHVVGVGDDVVETMAAGAAALITVSLIAVASARRTTPRLWAFVAGGALTAGAAAAAISVGTGIALPSVSAVALPLAGAAVGLIGTALLRGTDATWARAGALIVLALTALPSVAVVGITAVFTLTRTDDESMWPSVVAAAGLSVAAVALVVTGRVARRRASRARGFRAAARWVSALAVFALVVTPYGPPEATVAAGAAIAAASGEALRRRSGRVRIVGLSPRLAFALTGHAALGVAVVLAWSTAELAVASWPGVLAAAVWTAHAAPARFRWLHVAAAYGYSLIVAATALALLGLASVPVVSLTTTAAAVVAIVATFVRAVPVHAWWAVLGVTAVPFVFGVLQVVEERSGWTALSTGIIFVLALVLLLTRRAGLVPPLRAVFAMLLVPSLAVVVVCVGAWLLPVSGSPIVLPVVAAIVVCALPAAGSVEATFARRVPASRMPVLLRTAMESSALLTGVIAVALALGRTAAGLPTAVLVLTILATGTGAAAAAGRRRMLWWLAGISATGALWCAWRLWDVQLLEAYVLPPALGVVAVGAALARTARRGSRLYAGGLLAAVLPSVVALAGMGGEARMWSLLGASAVLASVGALVRSDSAWGSLRSPTLVVAVLAGSAGTIVAARVGLTAPDGPGVLVALGLGCLGALPAAVAGVALTRTTERRLAHRWALAPALMYVAVAPWPAIRTDAPETWPMWVVMLAILAGVVTISALQRRGRGDMFPPVWFVFALAFATSVAAWSPRELRVEWFSLPLGVALLLAGALHLGAERAPERGTLASWPARWSGSWALLTPGLAVILGASIAATFTDPQTWRAILVIVMALAAILVGARRRLAAPFLVGVVVLPLENVSAFSVQIGRGIDSMPWWITLAVVGAVLLILAVSYERRDGEAAALGARLRDLR